MNIINKLMGKGDKIEDGSPIKKSNRLTPAQEIYLQQIVNYINSEGGYDVLKQRLFRELNQNYMPDSPFPHEIVIRIRNGMDTGTREKERRSIIIIEDLLIHCPDLMNQVFNDPKFVMSLYHTCLYMKGLKSEVRDQLRTRACGIFLYWEHKFKDEPNYLYHEYYQKLRAQNAEFPSAPWIKQSRNVAQNESKKQDVSLTKQQVSDVDVVILDCEQKAQEAEYFLTRDKTKINTEYVRMIKAKNKKVYAISTNADVKLTSQQKQRLSAVYKKLRNTLKEIDKMNEDLVKEKALKKQMNFLQQKIEVTTPKKIEKEIPKIPMISSAKKSPSYIQIQAKSLENSKKSIQKQQPLISVDNQQLLSSEPIASKSPIASQQAQHQDIFGINKKYEPQFHTPTKSSDKSEDVLGLNQGQSSEENSAKKLNFKELYAQNQLSPDLKQLDLLSPSQKKGPEKLEQSDEEEGNFGEFN